MRPPPGARVSFGPRLTKGVAWILGIEIGLFLVYVFAGDATQRLLLRWLALTPESLAQGHVWKLFTSALLVESGLGFFFDVLMLWLFIPVLERAWGTRRFVRFAISTMLVGHLAGALVGLLLGGGYAGVLLIGLSPFILASIAAYGAEWGDQPIHFFGVVPMKAKVLAIGAAVLVGISVLLDRRWVDGAASFAAMGFAWATVSGRITPSLWLLQWRRRRLRRRYVVLDGGSTDDRDRKRKQWLN